MSNNLPLLLAVAALFSVAFVLQAPLLMGMNYQCQCLAFVWGTKRLSGKVWQMRIGAVAIGGLLGVTLIPVQVEMANTWFERQQPFVEMLTGTTDHCDAFKRYLLANPLERMRCR